jgi:surface antigen
MRKFISISIIALTIIISALFFTNRLRLFPVPFQPYELGDRIDSFNNVYVYYNGWGREDLGRNSDNLDKYDSGIKWECVEFVRRYYYAHLDHKIPREVGNAIDYYKHNLNDGQLNIKSGLLQYKNPSKSKPHVNDVLVFDKTNSNKYGHVAIVSKVSDTEVEIIQQNAGAYGNSRDVLSLSKVGESWEIGNKRVLAWLRKY